MRKLSQRELGFVYILLAVIIFVVQNPISSLLSPVLENLSGGVILFIHFLILIVFLFIPLLLFIKGLIKIFSKKSKLAISETSLDDKKTVSLSGVILWLVFGVIFSTSLFWITQAICPGSFEETWDCKLFAFLFGALPLTIIGIVSLVIGLVKLNRYMKERKKQRLEDTSVSLKKIDQD